MTTIFATFLRTRMATRTFAHYLGLLPRVEQCKVCRFRHWQDRQRSLVGKLLLQYGLRQYGLTGPFSIHRDRYGRPYQTELEDIDFNITHSGEWILCGISNTTRIGLDVEETLPISKSVAQTYFHPIEQAWLDQNPETWQTEFYRIWTLKESFLKAKGETFLIPLDSFWFDLTNPDHILFSTIEKLQKHDYAFHCKKLDASHVMALCQDQLDHGFTLEICTSIDDLF